MKTKQKPIIPIFYAADKNYLPYLAVSICSLKDNASKNYHYSIYVLTSDMELATTKQLDCYKDEDFSIEFVDVNAHLEEVKNSLQLRDYYTGATYYRIFIANMFPYFDKALYVDADTVVLGDISELFNVDLQDNLIGAIPDGAVGAVEEFRIYTKETLGIEAEEYFNAGVILMNLDKFRQEDFYGKFCLLLKAYKFCVAQDQDYLNVLCYGKVKYIDMEWNRMPIKGDDEKTIPKLIHYNLTMKPWHYENILFAEYFWYYAKQTSFMADIMQELNGYSEEKKGADMRSEINLKALALKEARRTDNYYKRFCSKLIVGAHFLKDGTSARLR